MRIIGTTGLTPKKFKDIYYNLYVTVGKAGTQPDVDWVFEDMEGIKLRRYLIAAYAPNDKEKRKALQAATDAESMKKKRAIKEHRKQHLIPRDHLRAKWEQEIEVKHDSDTRIALLKAYDGKGWPEDYEWALTIAVETGTCKANKAAMQHFADKYLGIDCSGFVNAYFQKKGKLKGRRYWTISDYAQRTERGKLRDVQPDDCLIWVRQDGTLHTGPGHIMLVDGRKPGLDPDGKDDVLHVVESTGGGIGLNDSYYRRTTHKEIRKGANKFTIFQMNRSIPGKPKMWVKIVKPF